MHCPLNVDPVFNAKFKVKGDTDGSCQCHFRMTVYVCVSSDSKGRNDEDEDVDDAVAAIIGAPLTEYGLQHGRYEEHCFAAKLVGEVARYDATCCDAQQKEHLGHVLQVLLVADQIPLRGPRVAQIVVRIVLPAAAGNQFATFRCCLCCLLL